MGEVWRQGTGGQSITEEGHRTLSPTRDPSEKTQVNSCSSGQAEVRWLENRQQGGRDRSRALGGFLQKKELNDTAVIASTYQALIGHSAQC